MTLDLGLAARVITGIRTVTAQHTGCVEWETPGVAAALRSTEGPPGAVLAAAALAAEDASLRFPTEAGFRAHWPKNASAPPKANHNVPCVDHPTHDMPCTHPDHAGDMTPEQIAEAAAAARAAVKPYQPHIPGTPKEDTQ